MNPCSPICRHRLSDQRWISLLCLLVSCSQGATNRQSVVRPRILSEAAPPLVENDTGTDFVQVAEFDYPVSFAPLGNSALLVADIGLGHAFFLIEENRVLFRPELNHFDQLEGLFPLPPVTGGEWPNEAWLALNGSSDAGPSWAALYRWMPASRHKDGKSHDGRWVKQLDHDLGLKELVPWGERLVLSGALFSVPVRVPQKAHWLHGQRLSSLPRSTCTGALQFDGITPRSLERDGWLSMVGFACEALEQSPGTIVIERWSPEGDRTVSHFAIDTRTRSVTTIILTDLGAQIVFSDKNSAKTTLAEVEADGSTSLATWSSDSSVVPSATGQNVYVQDGARLDRWASNGWQRMMLPTSRLRARQVWLQSETSVWLIAEDPAEPGSHLLLHTGGATKVGRFPRQEELARRSETRGHDQKSTTRRAPELPTSPRLSLDLPSGHSVEIDDWVATIVAPDGARALQNYNLLRKPDEHGTCPSDGFIRLEREKKGFRIVQQNCSAWYFIEEHYVFQPDSAFEEFLLAEFVAKYFDRRAPESDPSIKRFTPERGEAPHFIDLIPDEVSRHLDE